MSSKSKERTSPGCGSYEARFSIKRGLTPLIVYIFVLVATFLIYLAFPDFGDLGLLFTEWWGWLLMIGVGFIIGICGFAIGSSIKGEIKAGECEMDDD